MAAYQEQENLLKRFKNRIEADCILRNYLKIAWRAIWKDKAFSVINIFGLSVGIAFAMLIAGYVWAEFQVNKQFKNPGGQFILQSKWKNSDMGIELTLLIIPVPVNFRYSYIDCITNHKVSLG